MLHFHMSDIIQLLELPYPPSGRISYEIPCPCCDNNRGKHLNINLKKDVFRCPKCGFSGGVFDLYSQFTGVDRDKARDDIKSRLGYGGDSHTWEQAQTRQRQLKIEVPDLVEFEPTDIETRDRTYRALLELLTLASDHRENLLNRGLSKQAVEDKLYRTTPLVGTRSIAKKLREAGHDLAGVPGFYRNDSDNWLFVNNLRGILIPVRDLKGRIQGIQIRRDNVKRRKFRWVASTNRKDGCGARGWVHIAGPITETIILIEGPLKADVIHHLTGLTVIAVPGVNALTQLKDVLMQLNVLGVKKIMTAFDMDFMTNHNVQNGYTTLLRMIDAAGFQFGTYLWHPEYNGLDDYIWEFLMRDFQVQA